MKDQNENCPICGSNKVEYLEKPLNITYRKEEFTILSKGYTCHNCGETFATNGQMDEMDKQLDALYRQSHNIPSAEEIRNLRLSYKLSAARISEILGFGINTYRLYEEGDMPTIANARLIQLASEPSGFYRLANLSRNTLKEKQFEKLLKIISDKAENLRDRTASDTLFIAANDLQKRVSWIRGEDIARKLMD